MFNLSYYVLIYIYLEIYLTYHLFHYTDCKWQEKSEPVVFYSIDFIGGCIKGLPIYLLELPSQMLVIDSLNGVF